MIGIYNNISNPKFNKIMIFYDEPVWKEISKEKYEYEENKAQKIIEAKGGDIITKLYVWESFYSTYKKEPIYKEGVGIIELIKNPDANIISYKYYKFERIDHIVLVGDKENKIIQRLSLNMDRDNPDILKNMLIVYDELKKEKQ